MYQFEAVGGTHVNQAPIPEKHPTIKIRARPTVAATHHAAGY
jgi:hypothetical protein